MPTPLDKALNSRVRIQIWLPNEC